MIFLSIHGQTITVKKDLKRLKAKKAKAKAKAGKIFSVALPHVHNTVNGR